MDKDSSIYVAGHSGLVGSAIVRRLRSEGYSHILLRSHDELDLERQKETEDFFLKERPEYVFFAAARVGGIRANSERAAEFIYSNAIIAANLIHSAYKAGVKKLINLGSSCIYPKYAPQPIREESLLDGKLEPTNEAYAIAKIAALKMCWYYGKQYGCSFLNLMPCNLYGEEDNFDPQSSHVLPAIIRKCDDAKQKGESQVVLWGDGSPMREFLHSDDMASALLFVMNTVSKEECGELINVGTGKEISIKDLAQLVKTVVGYEGDIVWDTSKPKGTPRKCMDVGKIHAMGWKAKIPLAQGIQKVYRWYVEKRKSSGEI